MDLNFDFVDAGVAANSGGGGGGYVSTTVMRDYPVIAVYAKAYDVKPGFKNDGIDDVVIGHFVCLNDKGEVVMSKANARWSIKRASTGKPGMLFRVFENKPGKMVVGSIALDTPSWADGTRMNMWKSPNVSAEVAAGMSETLKAEFTRLEDESDVSVSVGSSAPKSETVDSPWAKTGSRNDPPF